VAPVTDVVAPVFEASTLQGIEPVSAYIAEPLSTTAIAQNMQQPLLEGAAYTSSVTEEAQGTKTEGSISSQPRLFNTSLLLGGQLMALAAEAAAAVKELPGGIPNPLLPFGLPFGALPAGSTFASSSGMGIGLDLLAVLALLLVLSRIGGTSVSPSEGFRLASSPRLVTELPG